MFLVGIASFIVAMAVTWMITPGVIRLAGWLGAIDIPGGRKTHKEPIPRIGGLAVFLGFLAGLAFGAYATGNLFTLPENGVYWRGLVLVTTGLFLVGMFDDLWGLSFVWKFAAQILAAGYIWNCGFRIEALSDLQGGAIELGALSLPLTVLWIVGITNAVNLIDGLDGLAAGIALITTGAVAVIAFTGGRLGTTAASVALAGSLIGFLYFNFNPARIFLGDSGSLFLGFVLAVTSVRGSQKGTTVVAVLAPLLILGLPLLDTGLAVTRRLYRLGSRGSRTNNVTGYVLRNFHHVFLPDRGHIHHRLMDMGLSHRGAVLLLYTVGGMFALAAFALVTLRTLWLGALLVGALLVMTAVFGAMLYLGAGRPRQISPAEPAGDSEEVAAPVGQPHTTPAVPLASSTGQVRGR